MWDEKTSQMLLPPVADIRAPQFIREHVFQSKVRDADPSSFWELMRPSTRRAMMGTEPTDTTVRSALSEKITQATRPAAGKQLVVAEASLLTVGAT